MNFNLTEDQLMIQRMAREFTQREVEPIADQVERERKIPDDLIKKMAQVGLLGMPVPKKYGGSEAGNVSCILALEQVGYAGSGCFIIMLLNNGVPELIARYGSEELKKKYLRALCDGTAYGGVQFTEADTGSDPRMLVTTAIPDGDSYLVNGAKRFITAGGKDGYAVLWAKDETGNCSAFVIEKNVEGYTADKQWDLMGWAGWEALDVLFENMRVPKENLLGAKGDGYNIVLHSVASEKVAYSAVELGVAQAALDEAIGYAKERMLRDRPMSAMQGIQWMLAEMHSRIAAARWLTYRTAFLQDEDSSDFQREAAATKLFVIPAVLDVVRQAICIHGAYGYTKEFKIDRLYRAAAGGPMIMASLEINKSIVGSSLVR